MTRNENDMKLQIILKSSARHITEFAFVTQVTIHIQKIIRVKLQKNQVTKMMTQTKMTFLQC